MNDAKILRAIETLHIRFMEAPTEQKAQHMTGFICGHMAGNYRKGCKLDVTPPIWDKISRYETAVHASNISNFNPASIAHLETVAEEIFNA